MTHVTITRAQFERLRWTYPDDPRDPRKCAACGQFEGKCREGCWLKAIDEEGGE